MWSIIALFIAAVTVFLYLRGNRKRKQGMTPEFKIILAIWLCIIISMIFIMKKG